jgi:hypothetical protein
MSKEAPQYSAGTFGPATKCRVAVGGIPVNRKEGRPCRLGGPGCRSFPGCFYGPPGRPSGRDPVSFSGRRVY